MSREFEPEYGSHRVFIKALGREVEFCNACGEYITTEGICSNPSCPEVIPDVDPKIEVEIDAYYGKKNKQKSS